MDKTKEAKSYQVYSQPMAGTWRFSAKWWYTFVSACTAQQQKHHLSRGQPAILMVGRGHCHLLWPVLKEYPGSVFGESEVPWMGDDVVAAALTSWQMTFCHQQYQSSSLVLSFSLPYISNIYSLHIE